MSLSSQTQIKSSLFSPKKPLEIQKRTTINKINDHAREIKVAIYIVFAVEYKFEMSRFLKNYHSSSQRMFAQVSSLDSFKFHAFTVTVSPRHKNLKKSFKFNHRTSFNFYFASVLIHYYFVIISITLTVSVTVSLIYYHQYHYSITISDYTCIDQYHKTAVQIPKHQDAQAYWVHMALSLMERKKRTVGVVNKC